MKINDTMLGHFSKALETYFDAGVSEGICICAERRFQEMLSDAEYRHNEQIRWHMQMNLLPGIAIYLALLDHIADREKAIDLTDEVFEVARIRNQRKNKLLGALPFGYALFKHFAPAIIARQYPEEGWRKRWVRKDKGEICFEMKTCIYLETTTAYGCPELCPLFCKNDDVVLAGFGPRIVFKRTGTLAEGSDCCDFHFCNGRPGKE